MWTEFSPWAWIINTVMCSQNKLIICSWYPSFPFSREILSCSYKYPVKIKDFRDTHPNLPALTLCELNCFRTSVLMSSFTRKENLRIQIFVQIQSLHLPGWTNIAMSKFYKPLSTRLNRHRKTFNQISEKVFPSKSLEKRVFTPSQVFFFLPIYWSRWSLSDNSFLW